MGRAAVRLAVVVLALVESIACAEEPAAVADLHVAAPDRIRQMQAAAEAIGHASWGHWGDQPERYVAWSNHSNRLIPVYTFGMSLDAVKEKRSVYRDAARLQRSTDGFPTPRSTPLPTTSTKPTSIGCR